MRDNVVSIIVPVYNMEHYLKKCIDSLTNQTYRDIQIILVDDGSTDHSSSLCDMYAREDNRITVIHKVNGGLSDARNAGLTKATGEYITFVDSDDYVDLHYVEKLLQALIQNGSDISVCAERRYSDKDGIDNFFRSSYRKISLPITMSNVDGLKNYFYQDLFDASSWGKLYRAQLLDDIVFPVGKIHEDIGTTYKIFLRANMITFIPDEMYFYFQRKGSILHSGVKEKNLLDGIELVEKQKQETCSQYPEVLRAANCRCFSMYSYVFLSSYRTSLSEYSKKAWDNIVNLRWKIILDGNARKKAKAAAFVSFLGKRVFYLLGNRKR